MGTNCARVSKEDMQTLTEKLSKAVMNRLKALNVSTEGLTLAEAIAVISKIMTETHYTLDTVMELLVPNNKRLLNDAVAKARITKMQEKQALENNKIGNAVFTVVKDTLTKGDPRKHRDTLYIFPDNLQASNQVFNEQIGDVIEVEEGVKLNVKGTSALLRTDTNGDVNPNVVGLVVKKNAQKEDGVFINEEGYFQDTDADFNIFVEANQRAINKIKDLLFSEDSPITNISMIAEFATKNAALPERFADKLADMLEKELGIYTQKIPNGKLFGLKIMPLGKTKQEKKNKKKTDKIKQKMDEILASYLAERPKLNPIQVDPNDRSLLAQVYPDIEQRIARVSYISETFSRKLTDFVNKMRKRYANMPNRDEEEEALYQGLIKGKVSDQRVFALGHFFIEEETLGSYLLNEIKEDLINIATIGSTEEGIEKLANMLLGGIGTLGKDFKEELIARGLNENRDKAYRFAFARARYLAREYATMSNNKVFDALIRDAAYEMEFNENIRLNFEAAPIRTEEEEEEDKDEEEKENANREGYMIKYKLTDPSKTLSTEIKTLLGSIYKRDYKDPTQYVFNDLGGRVRMDALVAYRILLEEFSAMKSPDAFNATLKKAIEKYPWLNDLKDILIYNPLKPTKFNERIRNEFFTAMRKAQVPYGMVSERGLLKRLNRNSSSEDIMDNARMNYEGRIVLGDHSIYTETGEINIDNCMAIDKLFSIAYEKKGDRITGNSAEARSQRWLNTRKKAPFGWALSQLQALESGRGIVENVVSALNLLAGYDEDHPRLSLEKTLRNLGIDTSKINVDSLFGDIPFMEEDDLADIKTLDDLNEHLSTDQLHRLVNALIAIKNIVSQSSSDRLQPGDHLLLKFQGSYLMLGSALSLASEGYTAMTFRHAKAMRASYAAPDFISDLVGIVQNTNSIEEATAWLEKEYGQYDFFKDPLTGEWNNTWLELFFNPGIDENHPSYPFRKNFDYMNVLSFLGSDKDSLVSDIKEEKLLKGLVYAFFAANADSEGNSYGWYRSPLFSDVDAIVLMKGVRYTGENYKENIAKGLAKVILQEVQRIQSIENPKEGEQVVDIEFYNSGRTNGALFQYFPELNGRKDEILEVCTIQPGESPVQFVKRRNERLAEIAASIVDIRFSEFIKQFSESELLSMYKNIARNQAQQNKKQEEEQKSILVQEALDEKEDPKEKVLKLNKMAELLTEFYWNDFFAQSQIQQLLGGDLAYYKNFTDYVKRNKQAYACGDRLFARQTNEQGEIIGDLNETAIYLEDEDVITNTYEDLKKLLTSSNLNDADRRVMEFALNSFEKICSTDGQSLRSLDSFKKIFNAKGTWTDEMEEAYQNIKRGRITAKDFLALWNPIKPFYFGHESIRTNGRNEKVNVQHKNSEYMITALYSFLNTALNRSPKLVGLHQFMENHNIDVVHFHSVVKEGYNSPFDLNYNKAKFDKMSKEGKITLFGKPFKGTYKEYMKTLTEALKDGDITQQEFNEAKGVFDYQTAKEVTESLERQLKEGGIPMNLRIKTFPMDSYMIVQPSGDHLIDDEAIFGTQVKNIIMADLPENFSMEINLNGEVKKLNREESVSFYNTLLVDNLLDAFKAINSEFTSIEKLQEALFARMKQNPQYGEDVKAALQINESGTGFMLPFNSPTLSNKIESLMFSVFKNSIQRQHIKGGNTVLVSNFGLHDNLHVKYVNDDPEQGVEYIPAYLPAASSSMYKDFLVQKGDYEEIDFEKMKKSLGESKALELLDIIGYRIPTEDKYSIFPIRVVGFMPVTAGTTIMLPADIVNMSGTDFDIDKLFLMMKEFDRITYPSSLSYEFKNWLENNKKKEAEADNLLRAIFSKAPEDVEAAISEGDKAYDSLKNLLRKKKEGYTDKEIDYLIEKSDVFADFMDEKGYSMHYETPKYKVLKPEVEHDGKKLTLDEISRQSNTSSGRRRIAIRNNMLIDVMRQTLSHPEVSKLLMQPGNYKRVKHSSRQQKIMHNPDALRNFMKDYKKEIKAKGLFTVLQEMSTDELEKYYENNAQPISPLDITDYVKMQRNLMDGNALIGMFAVNSSNHYKLQFMPCKIANDYQLTINKVKITHVDLQNSLLTGERIGRINAEYQAASPDNGKDPCLGDVGANTKTASRIGLLARMGLEPEMIGMINTADDFANFGEWASIQLAKNKIKLPPASAFNLDMNELTTNLAKFRINNQSSPEYESSLDELVYAAQFYRFMKSIKTLAKTLNGVSKVSRSDSPNGALAIDLPGVVQQYFKAVDFITESRRQDAPIKGLYRLVNTELDATRETEEELRKEILKAPIPRLQAAYTLGIKSAMSLCSEWFPGLSRTALSGVSLLRDQLQKELTYERDTTIVRRFLAELTMALLSKNSMFATDDNETIIDKRNYYIHDFPMKYKMFKEKKDGNRLAYPEVVNLGVIQRISNLDQKGLKFKNVGKTGDKGRKHYVEELESLLWKDKEEIREFAHDLFMYSYYDNGLQFSHNNFGIFFTTSYMKSMNGFIDSLNRSNAELINGSFDMANFVYQHILNHPDLAPYIKAGGFIIEGDKLRLTKQGEDNARAGYDRTGEPVMILQAKGKLWVKNGAGRDLHYIEIGYNKTRVPYYDMNVQFDEIDYDALKERGRVGYLSPERIAKATEPTEDLDNVPTEEEPEEFVENLGEVPVEEVDNLPDAPQEEDETVSSLIPMEDEESDPEDLEEQALEFTKLDEELDLTAPEEETLDDFPDTDDPDTKMC